MTHFAVSTSSVSLQSNIHASVTTAWKVPGVNSNRLFSNDVNGTDGTNTLYLQSAGNFDLGGQIVFGTGTPDLDGRRSETMRLSSGGNLGIGTTSPAHRVDVYASSGSSMRLATVGASTVMSVVPGQTSLTMSPLGNLAVGGTALMINMATGNVGIGTASPGTSFQINRSAAGQVGPILSLRNATGNVGDAAQIRFDVGALIPNGTIDWTTGVGGNTVMTVLTTKAGSLSESMRIDTSGNVGIANASPGSRLTVGGTIESVLGGFRFPDGTVQITSATQDSMGNPSDWTTPVYTVGEALDQLAQRIKALEP